MTDERRDRIVDAEDVAVDVILPLEVAAPDPKNLVPDPFTGEAVDCSDLAVGGEFVDLLREAKTKIDDTIRQAQNVMLAEMSRMGQGTVRVGRVQVEKVTKTEYVYDYDLLATLVELGLPEQRYREVVKQITEEKVDRRALLQVAAADPEKYGKVIDAATRAIPRDPTIKVTFGRMEEQ